jgi:hypothetical protein
MLAGASQPTINVVALQKKKKNLKLESNHILPPRKVEFIDKSFHSRHVSDPSDIIFESNYCVKSRRKTYKHGFFTQGF